MQPPAAHWFGVKFSHQSSSSYNGVAGDENPIRTLEDYSRPSREGYRNTIELPKGNNVVPLRSDTIRERTRLRLFQFSLRDQASNWLERLPAGCISTWEDLTTRFLTQFFPPGRTAKLHNDILMFQQHHGESISEAWTHFKDLLQKVPHHGIDRWLQIQIFYDRVSFHLKCEIDRASGGKLRNKNSDESWEIIENLALYHHEGWLLKLEDQIDFLLKGSRPTPTPSSAHIPQAYVNAFYPNSHPRNQNEPATLSTFAFHERTGPSPQPQALNTTFEARLWDYMAAHTERMKRFENTIFKQCDEINGRMTEMFGLLKELTTSRTLEKVLKREEAKFPITKNLNSIYLTKKEEGCSDRTMMTPDNAEKPTETETETPVIEVEEINEDKSEAKIIKTFENDEAVEAPGSQPVAYYLKHKINEKLIKGIVNNNRFNNSRSRTQAGKKKGKEYKRVSALVDQGSDVNVMPYSTYMRLTDEKPVETNIRLSLASHAYIYPLGIAEDVLVEIAEHVYPVDFVILDIRKNKNRPFILGTPFLTTAKASVKFNTGTITLKSGKHKASPGMGRKDKTLPRKGNAV
nr:hypothetical protein [Tanacetum cinerariifolium]